MSMYTDDYLDTAPYRPITPSTYLHEQLHGKAKQYERRYYRALMRDIERRVDHSEVVAIPSVRGGTAYVRT